LIKTTVVLKSAQFSLITHNSKQLITEKHGRYLHSEHYTSTNRTRIKFPKNDISLWQRTVTILSKSKLK